VIAAEMVKQSKYMGKMDMQQLYCNIFVAPEDRRLFGEEKSM